MTAMRRPSESETALAGRLAMNVVYLMRPASSEVLTRDEMVALERVRDAIAQALAEREAAGRAAAFEEAMKLLCEGCREGWKVQVVSGQFCHVLPLANGWSACYAAALRAAGATP